MTRAFLEFRWRTVKPWRGFYFILQLLKHCLEVSFGSIIYRTASFIGRELFSGFYFILRSLKQCLEVSFGSIIYRTASFIGGELFSELWLQRCRMLDSRQFHGPRCSQNLSHCAHSVDRIHHRRCDLLTVDYTCMHTRSEVRERCVLLWRLRARSQASSVDCHQLLD